MYSQHPIAVYLQNAIAKFHKAA